MANNPDIATALKTLAGRQGQLKKYQRYYDGDHDLAFATNKFKKAFADLFKEFSDNLCPAIVDPVSDRLRITGFGESTAGKAAWEIWKQNRMTQKAGEVHTDALTLGDGYVIVWEADDGSVEITVNTAESTMVYYSAEIPGRIDWAAKRWMVGKQVRLNLYYPDRIEKYITAERGMGSDPTARAFAPYKVPGEPWPILHPYGRVPVFHFPNNGRTGALGRSELKDVIPLQDGLNKALADMVVAMEYVALPQRWATGIEVKRDPVTNEPLSPWKPQVDAVWSAPGFEVKFGQFDPSDLTQFLQVQDSFRLEMARVSRTPIHFLMPQTGDFPSGESLKTAEAPFLAKVADRMELFGNVWQDVMLFALLIAGTTAKADDVVPDWRDPAPKSKKEQAETVQILGAIGVPFTQLLKELDYTQADIEDMITEEQQRQVSATNAALDTIRQRQVAASGGASATGDQAFVNSQQ